MKQPILPSRTVGPSFKIELELSASKPRIDTVLLEALRLQNRNPYLKRISRTEFKELFKKKRIRIKGQPAVPSSGLAQGKTTVEIIGYQDYEPPKAPTRASE